MSHLLTMSEIFSVENFKMHASESDEENNGEDIWDDKKLNDAYDKALRIANAEVAKRVAMSTNSKNNSKLGPNATPSSNKVKKSKEVNTDKKPQWKVGMPCRAVYEEDGLEYEAVVLRIINQKECIVRFVGYNNSEIVPINSLKQTHGKEARTDQIEQAICEQQEGYVDDMVSPGVQMEVEPEPVPSPDGTERSFQKRKKSANRKKKPQNQNFHLPELPGMPALGPFPSFLKNLNVNMPMPPIPPPQLPSSADSEDQAVSSMLLSWYMSGYYTGLYQGLRRAKESKKH